MRPGLGHEPPQPAPPCLRGVLRDPGPATPVRDDASTRAGRRRRPGGRPAVRSRRDPGLRCRPRAPPLGSRIVARREHLRGVDRQRDAAARRPLTAPASWAAEASKTSSGWTSSGRYPTPSASSYGSPMASGSAAPMSPLTRNAVTLRRCHGARSSRTTTAALVEKSVTPINLSGIRRTAIAAKISDEVR